MRILSVNNSRAERMCMPTRQDSLLDGWMIYMGLLNVFRRLARAGKLLNSLDGS